MTRRITDQLVAGLVGCLIGVGIMAAISPQDAWTVIDPTPRSSQQPTPRPGTRGMTTDGVSPVPSPDAAGRTEAPSDVPVSSPSPSPTRTRPEATPKPRAAIPSRPTFGLRGVAVWYDYRRGHAAAGPLLRKALGAGWRGTTVRVCSDGRCIRVVLSDWCACQSGRRLVDLDRRSFAALADPSRGVIPVTVEW